MNLFTPLKLIRASQCAPRELKVAIDWTSSPPDDLLLGEMAKMQYVRINELRRSKKLASLNWSDSLERSSFIWGSVLKATRKFEHELSGYPGIRERIQKVGYDSKECYENLSYVGHETLHPLQISKVMQSGLEASKGHYRNMLQPRIEDIGISVIRINRWCYLAVQNFGLRMPFRNSLGLSHKQSTLGSIGRSSNPLPRKTFRGMLPKELRSTIPDHRIDR